MSKEDRYFSSTEVGTLIESLRSEISVIAEEVKGASSWRIRTDQRLDSLETDMHSIKDVIRLTLPRISLIETKLGI